MWASACLYCSNARGRGEGRVTGEEFSVFAGELWAGGRGKGEGDSEFVTECDKKEKDAQCRW